MDSLTQITLGAAVGEATLGRKVGNKAMLWGAIAGTIPDLDVLASPFISDVQRLVFHRSFTHSILFAVLFAPVLGKLIARVHANAGADWRGWSWLSFWGLFTHPLLDSLTIWGTQLFWPFSNYRVAVNSVFVADPLYTLPFLFFLIAAMFFKRSSKMRWRLNTAGLVISTAYLLTGLVIKTHVNTAFERSLQRQGISFSRYFTNPTPLNIVLWIGVAESEEGFWQGYYSIFDKNRDISFRFIPKNHHLISGNGHPEIEKLKWVSKGFFAITEKQGRLLFNDLRFTQSDTELHSPRHFLFAYELPEPTPHAGMISGVRKVAADFNVNGSVLKSFWQRIKGIDGMRRQDYLQLWLNAWHLPAAPMLSQAFLPGAELVDRTWQHAVPADSATSYLARWRRVYPDHMRLVQRPMPGDRDFTLVRWHLRTSEQPQHPAAVTGVDSVFFSGEKIRKLVIQHSVYAPGTQ